MNLPPFEQGRSFRSQFTARRMNDLVRSIPRLRFSGGGADVSHLGDQVFIKFPRPAGVAAVILAALQPGSDVSSGSTPMYTITYGTYGGFIPTISGTPLVPTLASNIITLGSTDVAVYMQCDFTYTSGGVITVTDAQIHSTASTVPTSTISGGSGTLYQQLFGVTVTITGGVASVVAAPGVGGSQNFNVCLAGPAINGPWGV